MLIDANFLFKKDSPTTVIDLSNKKVYRTAILNDFIELKSVLNQLNFHSACLNCFMFFFFKEKTLLRKKFNFYSIRSR